SKSGKVGCPACYATFYDRLLPMIQRLHGKTRHVGKIPAAGGEELRREQELEALRKQLAEAVEKQEFETCASLRDRIRELEG
ncbi:MAG: UvrB/UvrC motif-containing protein, partial [Oscillospiraceae bacterium]|nr:UvrB/UvrC motif-containing protein [Oscillospiraceae bacterium]